MNLDTEIKTDYTIPSEMKRVWQTELELTQVLMDVCERHGLKFWMECGTLLGAVRHQGFIPWDDDMDFVMMRKDYDKLVAIAKDEFKAPYVFQTFHTEKGYFSGQAQIRKEGTTCMSLGETDRPYCRGIFIDIFVLEGFIDNPVLRFGHRMWAMMLHKTIHRYVDHKDEPWRWSDGFTINFAKLLYSIWDYRKAFDSLENWFRLVDADKCKHIAPISWKYRNKKFVRNRSSYDKTIWLPFEDTKLPSPSDTHDALICYFGENYMTPLHLPTDHGHIYFDADRPYQEVAEELKQHPENFDKRIHLLYTDLE